MRSTRPPAIDFTSSLYLGLTHASDRLRPWASFTTGKPAILHESPDARRLAAQLAELQGCEAATLASSTLHIVWDVFGMFDTRRSAIFVDAGTYPIARWGTERAAARAAPVREFAHHDVFELEARLHQDSVAGRVPLVVTDGFCPACGAPAPIPDYLRAVRQREGVLIVDDTQALGILGEAPGPDAPYGHGGGGTLRWHASGGGDVLAVSSLAKAFGAPVAVLAGSRRAIDRFEACSQTRIHCSPPSIAALRAAEHALAINRSGGEALRQHLWQLIRHFRTTVNRAGRGVCGGMSPLQTIVPRRGLDAGREHQALLGAGIRTLLRQVGAEARIAVLITVRHRAQEIERLARALAPDGPS